MTQFKNLAFGARWLVMGDIAEAAFRRRYPEAVRTGLDRAPTTKGLSLMERYEPDFRLGPKRTQRIEVMGIGRDQKLKLKVEKSFALCQWSAIEDVDLYVWDSYKKRDTSGPIDGWIDVLFKHGVYAYFPEGKAYIELHARHFPYPWEAACEEEDEAPTATAGGAGG